MEGNDRRGKVKSPCELGGPDFVRNRLLIFKKSIATEQPCAEEST
jgi:hypothetical protein